MNDVINPKAQEIQDLAARWTQWVFGKGGQGEVLSKASFENPGYPARNVSLYNTDPKLFLQYEEQTFGINLGWTDDASNDTAKKVNRWFFARQNGTGRAITYGERVALGYGTHRSFIQYASRTFGINLDWSGPPVFEWVIVGGQPGSPVRENDNVAIWNDKTHHFFIYFDRNIGGNIGWDDSKRWEDDLPGIGDLVEEYGPDVVKYAVAYALGVPELPALADLVKALKKKVH